MGFEKWYLELTQIMSKHTCNEGMVLRPDDYAEKEVWEKYFNDGFSPLNAYLEER